MRVSVEPKQTYKLINHGPTTLITTAHGGKTNVMAAAWVMALDINPPKVVAVIAEGTYTRELIDASRGRLHALGLDPESVARLGRAAAVINSALGRKNAACCCVAETKDFLGDPGKKKGSCC